MQSFASSVETDKAIGVNGQASVKVCRLLRRTILFYRPTRVKKLSLGVL